MKTYKVLNLYACLGGNRYKWDESAKEAGVKLEVTAVELDPELARLYKERFPNDIMIVADAHQYLLDHYKEFDFIWSSINCPRHSRARFWKAVNYNSTLKPVYPDFQLYEEVVFLKHYFKGDYVVENVIPYYEPLYEPQKRGRHLYWSNLELPKTLSDRKAPSARPAEACGEIPGVYFEVVTSYGCLTILWFYHRRNANTYLMFQLVRVLRILKH